MHNSIHALKITIKCTYYTYTCIPKIAQLAHLTRHHEITPPRLPRKPTPRVMFVLTTLAVVLLALHAWAVSAQDCSCNDKVCLYESIKSQLTSTYNADNLLFGFFTKIPFYGSVNISSAVNLSFQFVNGTSWYNEEITWTHFWYPYSSTGALRALFPWTFRGAVASNSYSKTLDLAVSISCVSNTMNPVTLKTSLNDLYSSILQWVSLLRQSLQLAVSGQDCMFLLR